LCLLEPNGLGEVGDSDGDGDEPQLDSELSPRDVLEDVDAVLELSRRCDVLSPPRPGIAMECDMTDGSSHWG